MSPRARGVGYAEEQSPTLTVGQTAEAFAINGNVIGREPENGGHQLCMADLTSNAAIDYDLCGTLKVGGGEPVVMAPSFSRRPAQQLPTNEDGLSFALTRGGCREYARHASEEADSDRV